ncbi:MAG TPA: CstA-like transporter-associated (seleno)protein [Methylomirabilota bacterium]|nr:CstA-like transporter-associated (seleno)protein [Methylomirabilota bacterium]
MGWTARNDGGSGRGQGGILASLGITVGKFWQGLREWSGDAAYETYVQYARKHRAAHVLSREEFYVEQLKRKYSRVSRCC